MSIFTGLRQFLYPSEFRINPLKAFDLNTILKVIANLPDKGVSQTISEESQQFLVDLCLSLWRLQQKMLEPGTDRPIKEMRHAYQSLTSVWNSLIQAEITIQEYTNTIYHSNLPVTVAGYQEVPGISQPKVIETLKPTVYLEGNPIRFGEVILGIPPSIG